MANATTQFGGFLTNTGIAQQANTAVLGLPWNITHMLIGDAGGDPSQTPDPTPKPTQTALVRQVYRAQLNALYQSPADPGVLVAELVLPPETGGWWIRELALEDANGNFIAVAKPAPSYKPLLAQGSGRTQTIRMHVVFGNLANVTLKVDPSIVLATRDYVDKAREAAELYARNQLKAHVEAADPHPQYLRRADAAKDVGPLAWLGVATGTADALTLKLKSGESALAAYAAGQRFQFQASATNTGAVTARINGLAAVAVKKSGNSGLVDLVGGDIRAGALYDLNYDGTYFQLGGGVGANKAFERYSFEASVGQTVFTLAHTIGNTIVLRNGREITDYLSDGQKITFKAPCSLGEAVEILAFSSFQAANSYTKAETQALLNTASALPVGTMLPFPRGTVPAGFLEVDGSTQSAAVYPDLAAYLGGAFNTGNEAAGFFRLPDTRGEFLRGWDHGRGVDSGRAIGSTQGEAFKAHTHKDIGFIDNVGGGAGASAVTGATGEVTSLYGKAYGNSASATAKAYKESAPGALGGAIAGLTSGSTGDSETRPRNLAVMWCIKAWNAPVNQGQIDVAALVAELTAMRSSTPVGAILPFPKAEVPAGYLELDGSLQSAATYPDLAAYLGTTYNKGGEPAGFFRLPDARGEFLRGWDHGRDADPGRELGKWQKGSLAIADMPASGQGAAALAPAVGQTASDYGYDLVTDATWGGLTVVNTGSLTPVTPGSGTWMLGMSRPRNLAVMWCIKAWSTPVNQGQLDVAGLATQMQELSVNGPLVGSSCNAAMSVTVASASATFTAGELLVGTAAGMTYRLRNLNKLINLTTVGAGGMDSGAAPAGGFVAIYAIYNPLDRVSALLASNATSVKAPEIYSGASMPAGFVASALVAVWRTDGSRLLVVGSSDGRRVHTPFVGLLDINSESGSMTPVSVAGYLPPNAKTLSGQLVCGNSSSGGLSIAMDVAGSSSGVGGRFFNDFVLAGGTGQAPFSDMPVLTPQTMFSIRTAAGGAARYQVYGSGYTF